MRPFERSTGCRVEVRYADGAESLRRAAERLCVRRRVDPGRRRLRGRAGRRSARAQPRARAAASDASARPSAIPRRRAPAARRYGVSFLWTPRLEIWRRTIRKHAPATWAPLSWNTKARRGRVSLEDTPLEIGDAALSLRKLRPTLGITDPYALNEAQFTAAVALTKRRVHLAGALWQLPGDEIDAFAGGLVDVGAGDWYTARQIRAQNVDVGLTLPREGAPGEIDLWMLGAHALHPGCAYRWMRYASGARRAGSGGALLRRHARQRRRLRAARQGACRALHADAAAPAPEAHRVSPHARRELRRRAHLRALLALGAGLERRAIVLKRGHLATSDAVMPG